MALNATIYKAELQVSDMDRHYYATHTLTVARHPSETVERLMVRLLAFALYADERLEFGKGLSDGDEPALWRKAYSGDIEQWIELGQPDEARIRKACGRKRAASSASAFPMRPKAIRWRVSVKKIVAISRFMPATGITTMW